jgi:tetratricopeptide (TPR) repeat protein
MAINTEEQEYTGVEQENRSSLANKPVAFNFSDYFDRHKKMVTYVGGGLIVLIAAIIGYRYYQSNQQADAEISMFRAQRYFENDSFKLALNGDGSPEGTGMKDIADEYSGTKAGDLAHYYVGMTYLQTGKYQDAIDELKSFNLKSATVYPLALGGIGDAYSQLKDYDEAAKYYMKAAKANDNEFTAPRFYKKAGMVYEQLKQYKDAVDAYQVIKDKYKKTPYTIDIDKYLSRAKAEAAGGE